MLLSGLHLMACSVFFLTESRTTSGPCHELGPPTATVNQENAPQACPQASLGHFLSWGSLFLNDASCVKRTPHHPTVSPVSSGCSLRGPWTTFSYTFCEMVDRHGGSVTSWVRKHIAVQACNLESGGRGKKITRHPSISWFLSWVPSQGYILRLSQK